MLILLAGCEVLCYNSKPNLGYNLMSMKQEAESAEEYVRLVEEQARAQQDEQVPSHREIIDNFESAKQGFQEKQCFYSLLLLLVALSYLVIRLFPKQLGLLEAESPDL